MPGWLGIIPISIGVVLFLGTTVIYLKGAADKSDIERLEQSNDTLEKSNEALIQRVGVLEASEARLTARVGLLERENTSLLAARPSADVLTKMQGDVAEIKAVMAAIAALMKDTE